MKLRSLTKVLIAGTLALGSLAIITQTNRSQPVPGERGFWCDTSSSVPTTMYQNSQGGREPWIKWTSDYFSGSGWDSLTRCRAVSDRLETYRRNRQLKYVTWGRMNNQNVICTALDERGSCVGLIYTLKPYQNPEQTLEHFFAWREGQAGLSSLYESAGKPRLYIDVRARLEEEAETVTQPNTPDDSQPTIPQPSQDQSGQREL
jgi:hypothetical protein